MSIIIFDTETTGLPSPIIKGLDSQPHIVEFAAIKLDGNTLEEIDRIQFLVKPPISMPIEVVKIHGITDAKLEHENPFSFYYQPLVDFFIGTEIIIAHNVAFDICMLKFELQRLGRITQFPWPPIHICTVNQTIKMLNYRLTLMQLYEHLFKRPFVDAHRAMNDVGALTSIVRELVKRELLKV